MRLDNYLVANSLIKSRTKAGELIKNSFVSVNGKIITKSSFVLKESDEVEIKEHKAYVSRSAHKLASFLDELQVDIKDSIALDIGASTGGFTQVLLQNNVREVSSVDVGFAQLEKSIKEDKRVTSYESCDIRNFKSEKEFDLVVSDVSFISLLNILDDIDRLASSKIILLFKPQFEVGREARRDKYGVVTDAKAIERAMERFEDATKLKEWRLIKKSPSQLIGKKGNLEYCYFFKK